MDTATPSAHAEQTALIEALQAALAELPEALRVCWILRELDHRSYDDIADIVGVPGGHRPRPDRPRPGQAR